jgi:hypothetical protein
MRSLHLAIFCGLLCGGSSWAQDDDGDELPADLQKAWAAREAESIRVELAFKATVAFFSPIEDEDTGKVFVPPPSPRVGKLILDGDRTRFEESGIWPLNREETTQHKLFDGKLAVAWVRVGDRTQATISKGPIRAKTYELDLQPLYWTLRPSTSVFAQHGAGKLFVEESLLKDLPGKCYKISEKGGPSPIIVWVHQPTMTIRQAEYRDGDRCDTRITLEYGRKDTSWAPLGWTRISYLANGEIESRADFKLDSVSLPKEIPADRFEFKEKPGLMLIDATVDPYKVFKIDDEGKRVPQPVPGRK